MTEQPQKLRIILTGATGMVGEGVLHECLQHSDVASVLVVGRRSCGVRHVKLKEVVHKDFFDLASIRDELQGYNSCLFCLGVSSIGMKEPEFHRLTYELTLNFAKAVASVNNNMTFCYISGAGTDSTEKGKRMWARVKGKTENDLLKLAFKQVYNFRPGIITPTPGLKNTLAMYKYLGWLIPVIRLIAPKYVLSLKQLGHAMINVCSATYSKRVLEVKDITELSKAKHEFTP
ncbi:epimerase [Segetibacter sp. 3557_3]|uniref:NAD-dependent epimerase/dehydratase family protein n=1 Tax=Segetibacter sp. 3557_3 TaxID=2547429 RepID=UPI001058619A|nr:NAD-dependent epimerase/dehydratase family protein [Segetibacter sp. 3557_3]TDH29021.1 epimerase [Segetibacter sp. 3557_3]